MFITFSTVAQAKNYIKRRHPAYSFVEGCGCCGYSTGAYIQNNLVKVYSCDEHIGTVLDNIAIVGKIKRKASSVSK